MAAARRSIAAISTIAVIFGLAPGLTLSDQKREQFAERWIYDEKAGEWRPLPPPEPGTEDGDLDIARRKLAHQEFKPARNDVRKWIKTYGTGAERYPEALYLLGTAEMERGDYRAGHEAFTKLLSEYPGSEFAERALYHDFAVAEQYLAGKRQKRWGGLLRLKAYDEGVKILDEIATNYRDTPLAEMALKTKADYFFRRGELELAQDEYQRLARDYPRSRYRPYALLQSAWSALASFAGVHFDDAPLVDAEERFRQIRAELPLLARQQEVGNALDGIRDQRAHKEFEIGRYYEKVKQKRAAAFYYRSAIRRWPGTTWALEAEVRLNRLGLSAELPATTTRPTETPAGKR